MHSTIKFTKNDINKQNYYLFTNMGASPRSARRAEYTCSPGSLIEKYETLMTRIPNVRIFHSKSYIKHTDNHIDESINLCDGEYHIIVQYHSRICSGITCEERAMAQRAKESIDPDVI